MAAQRITKHIFTQFRRFNLRSQLTSPRVLWSCKKPTVFHWRKSTLYQSRRDKRASLLRALASSLKVVCFVFIYQEQVTWRKYYKAWHTRKVILHSFKLRTHTHRVTIATDRFRESLVNRPHRDEFSAVCWNDTYSRKWTKTAAKCLIVDSRFDFHKPWLWSSSFIKCHRTIKTSEVMWSHLNRCFYLKWYVLTDALVRFKPTTNLLWLQNVSLGFFTSLHITTVCHIIIPRICLISINPS